MKEYFLKGGGTISEAIYSTDWNETPLGDLEKWPNTLKTSLNICLTSPFPMALLWGPQMILLYNQAFTQLLGVKAPFKALGKPASEFWKEIWERIGPMVEKVRSTGDSIKLQDQVFSQKRNGTVEDRYFTFSYSPIRDEEGICGVLSIANETTEKILNARRAYMEHERLEQFFQQAPAAVCVLEGPRMKFEMVNPAYQRLYPGRELLGKEVLDALPEIKGTPIHDVLLHVYQTGETFEEKEILVPFSRVDGAPIESIYFNFVYHPRRNAEKEIDGIFVFAYEVNEFVLAKKQLESNFKRFEKLANTLPQIVWTATPKGYFDYFNDQWFSYSGKDFNQSKGLGWTSCLHPEDFSKVSGVWTSSVETGDLFQIEARIRSAEGQLNWALIRALPIKDEKDHIYQWCGTCTLIQDQKKLEQEILKSNENLTRLNKELTQVNSDLDNFIYTASHDLKTPIANIEGLVDALTNYLKKDTQDNPVIGQLLQMIKNSIKRFYKTIHDLTEITKLQRLNEVEEANIPLEGLIEEIKLDLYMMINKSKGKIILELGDLKEIKFSLKNLRNVLYNLVSNGLKYRSPCRDPVIVISSNEEGEFNTITIQDNGMGMDPSRRDSIFGMFKRFHNHVEGSGIGLFIVKKIMDNAGGRIEVESKVGEGSKFKLFFKKANTIKYEEA